MNQNDFYGAFTPVPEYTLKLFNLAVFLAHVQQFPRLLDKFEVWVSCEALCDFFDWFFCLIFKNELQPDLLNTGFTITEIGLFYGDENLEAKIILCRFQAFLNNMANMFIFEDEDV